MDPSEYLYFNIITSFSFFTFVAGIAAGKFPLHPTLKEL